MNFYFSLLKLSCLIKQVSQGADPKNSERDGRDTCSLASYIDTFYFSENSIKIIQNFKEKGVATAPSAHP